MKTYIRETIKLGHGKTIIRKYTPGEYMISGFFDFLLDLFIIWPLQIFWEMIMIVVKAPIILFLAFRAATIWCFHKNKVFGVIVGIILFSLYALGILAIVWFFKYVKEYNAAEAVPAE